jgi:hypothetical protein
VLFLSTKIMEGDEPTVIFVAKVIAFKYHDGFEPNFG